MKDKLPRSVIRRKKEGFDIPAHHWLRTVLRPLLEETLTERDVEQSGIFSWKAVNETMRAHFERRGNFGYHLWGLLVLFLWMKHWKVQPPAPAAPEIPEFHFRSQLTIVCASRSTPRLLFSAARASRTIPIIGCATCESRRRSTRFSRFLIWATLGASGPRSVHLTRLQTLPRLALLYFVNAPRNPALDWILGGSDLFHASNQVRVAPRRVKLTATIYDLTCRLMPQFHTEGNVRAEASFAEKIVKRADGLIAISENTRQDAIRLLGVAPERIETIYPGITEEYFDAKPVPRERPYALYVGTVEPRKNLDTLLDAWKELKLALRGEFDLVIAGPAGWASEKTLARVKAETTYLGYVPENDLPGLIAGATVFVYPSLYEGFGFPPVQAMAAGVPVLTSNNSCLPEVVGDAAVLADPNSATEIRDGLTRLLESEAMRGQLAERGRDRARLYRWDRCAVKSLEFFHRIAEAS